MLFLSVLLEKAARFLRDDARVAVVVDFGLAFLVVFFLRATTQSLVVVMEATSSVFCLFVVGGGSCNSFAEVVVAAAVAAAARVRVRVGRTDRSSPTSEIFDIIEKSPKSSSLVLFVVIVLDEVEVGSAWQVESSTTAFFFRPRLAGGGAGGDNACALSLVAAVIAADSASKSSSICIADVVSVARARDLKGSFSIAITPCLVFFDLGELLMIAADLFFLEFFEEVVLVVVGFIKVVESCCSSAKEEDE